MHLIEVVVTAPEVELVGDRAWSSGAEGIWEVDAADGRVRVRVGVTTAARAAVLDALATWAPVDVTDREAVVLAAAEVTLEVAGRSLCVTVPPTVFGDGHHPTTQGCLAALAALVASGTTVLDVGCGSGILSVAAVCHGAVVTAVDIDPVAVAATDANAAAAALRVDASTRPVEEVAGTFDVVVANISAGTVLDLAEALAARVAGDGHLVVSGVLAERWPEVRAAFETWTVESETAEQGWCTATLSPASTPV